MFYLQRGYVITEHKTNRNNMTEQQKDQQKAIFYAACAKAGVDPIKLIVIMRTQAILMDSQSIFCPRLSRQIDKKLAHPVRSPLGSTLQLSFMLKQLTVLAPIAGPAICKRGRDRANRKTPRFCNIFPSTVFPNKEHKRTCVHHRTV